METLDSYVLMALVGVPFVWGILLAFLPGHRLQHIRVTSAAVAAVLMALTAYVFLVYDHEEGGFQLMREIAWLDSLGVAFSLGVDGISVPMVLLTGIVGLTGVLISWTIQERAKEFFVLFFLLVAGVYGVFVTLDLFFFFFFYELGRDADVPAHRRVGQQQRLRQLPATQGVRGDEADAVPGGGQHPGLGGAVGRVRGRRHR